MPGLFAYLIAVGLLLGGGYGTLNWLAAPEPVKVEAKTKWKPAPLKRDADNSVAAAPDATPPSQSEASAAVGKDNSVTAASNDRAAVASNEQAPAVSSDQAPSPRPEAGAAANRQGVQAEIPVPAQDQPTSSANAEASPAEAKQEHQQKDKQPARAEESGGTQTAEVDVPAAAAVKMAKRPHARQASRHSGKHPLTLMNLAHH